MLLALLLTAVTAWAAPVTEAEAEALARAYYPKLGQPLPAPALLADDVAALVETGRDAEELAQVLNHLRGLPGARGATLGALVESHLATALGEAEQLVPSATPAETLAPAPKPRGDTLSAEARDEVLGRFYAGTGRAPPTPPLAVDLAGFVLLEEEGWLAPGVYALGDWVPQHVRGAEMLSFGQVARVAVEKGFNGGPTRDGRLETLKGVGG
jgi:hypothetical protein